MYKRLLDEWKANLSPEYRAKVNTVFLKIMLAEFVKWLDQKSIQPCCPHCHEIMYDDDGRYECNNENCTGSRS